MTYADVYLITSTWPAPFSFTCKLAYGTPEYHRAHRAFYYACRAFWKLHRNSEQIIYCTREIDTHTRALGESNG